MIAVWILATVAGFAVAIVASRSALGTATELVAGTSLPPFFVGFTVLAIGTDLPEIANSITASLSGQGDVNVGDSLGSAATQVSLVLGLLPLVARPIDVSGRGHLLTGLLTTAALGLCALLLSTGELSRLDGFVLVSAWALGSWILYRRTKEPAALEPSESKRPLWILISVTVASLAVVAVGAWLAVTGMVQIAEEANVPVFMISFFGASIGTSLPELVVDVTALRRGQSAFALGDVFGSSFVDSTLSIGIGPLIAPTAVTATLAVRGAVAAMVVMAIVVVLMSLVKRHDWRTGLTLIVVYGALFFTVP